MRLRVVKNFILLDDLVLIIVEYFCELYSFFDNFFVYVYVKLYLYLVFFFIYCMNMIFFNR